MNPKRILHSIGLILSLGGLVACGGGGGGSSAGIGGTGISVAGTITGFGSIFVNGIEFETGAATVTIDDNSASDQDLRLGMVVKVNGTLDAIGTTGTATSVAFNGELKGPIANAPVDPTGDGLKLQFTLLGETVRADKTGTIFDDGVTFATLAQGDYIEVSGFFDAAGVLQATRIEGKGTFTPDNSEVKVTGMPTNGIAGVGFELNGLTVLFSGTLPPGVVEVEGTLNAAGDTITATSVEQEDSLFGDDEDKVSLEGIISDFVSISDFKVSGQAVNASAATLEPAGLVLGNDVGVEVEGPVVSGILQATEVEAEEGDIKIEATVQSVNTASSTVTLGFVNGTVTVLVDSTRTTLEDETGNDPQPPFTLGDISVGDFLAIEAYQDGSGNIVASELKRNSADDDLLQGPVDNCNGSSVVILGVSFSLVDGTTSYEDENETNIASATAFCNAVNAGSAFVKVKDDQGSRDGIADEAELED